jgi:hypothetical protein
VPNSCSRAHQWRLRDRQAERLGGLEIDDKVELYWLLNGEIAGFRTPEDLVEVDRQALVAGASSSALAR